MTKTLRIITKILSTTVLAIVVLLAVFLGGIRLVGLTPYTVLSGSMEPTYHVGSVIYTKKVAPTELQVGDPITYTMSGGVIVTHRITEIVDEGFPLPSFRTKGDVHKDTDPGAPIPANAVMGKALFSIPYLGFVSEYIKTPTGLFLIIGTCAGVLLMSHIIEAILEKPKKEENETTPAAEDRGTENNG